MTSDEARAIAASALGETSANHLQVAFVLEKEGDWVILLTRGGQDWVVRVPVQEAPTADLFRRRVAQEVQRLF
ncbi:MAG TPA: hypothetical protein VLU25_05275 [Acidobacteriota bacterium]|nr:hypothetical protein [Acidobacteriota bacterium]